MPPPILVIALMAIFALVSGCDSGQKAFFEPTLGDQHVAFVTESGAWSGPGNPVLLPPDLSKSLDIDGRTAYLASDSLRLIESKAGAKPSRLLFVEAQIHIVPSAFTVATVDGRGEMDFQKVVVDKLIRVEAYRESK